MALTATIYTFSIELTHMDRDLYATLELRVAQQPSETLEYMLTRVLAYCLEYCEGIAFSPGICCRAARVTARQCPCRTCFCPRVSHRARPA